MIELPLTTERLTLRLFEPGDVDDMVAYQGRDDVARYLYRPARTREQCAEVIARVSAATTWQADGDSLVLAIHRRTGGGVIGEIVLRLASRPARQAEIGWVLHPGHEGHGYATEAATAALARGLEEVDSVVSTTALTNLRSQRVMQRLGMRRELEFDHPRVPEGHRVRPHVLYRAP